MRVLVRGVIVAVGAAWVPQWLAGQAPSSLTPAQADSVVAETRALVQRRYGFDAKKPALLAGLSDAQRAGRYRVSSPRELADRVTDDLQRLSGDRHLGLVWNPEQYEAMRRRDAGSQSRSAEEEARLDAIARGTNHGLPEQRILPGNVRYLRIRMFAWRPDATGAAYDAAMRFLRDGDAVIIDLRDNGGGDASAVRYAISHFVPPDERLLMTFRDDDGRPHQSRALSHLPAGRIRAPLYVLTNERTGSAAEEFALHVRQFRLGTLVGAKTRGAGNSNWHFPIHPGFTLSLSLYAPFHAVDSASVEGVGLTPDLAVASDRALDAAHAAALERLAPSVPPQRRTELEWALEGARGRSEPAVPTEERLRPFVGTYGERRVWLENGALMYARAGAPPVRLIPLAADRFAFPSIPDVRLRFVAENGRVVALELYGPDGPPVRAPRTP